MADNRVLFHVGDRVARFGCPDNLGFVVYSAKLADQRRRLIVIWDRWVEADDGVMIPTMSEITRRGTFAHSEEYGVVLVAAGALSGAECKDVYRLARECWGGP